MPSKSTKSSKPTKTAAAQTGVANAIEAATLSPTELHSLISKRAYDLYLQRGAARGSELEDWLVAEREVTAALQVSIQAPGQTVEAAPAPAATKTRRTTRPSSVKPTEKSRSTTTHVRKKPAPEI